MFMTRDKVFNYFASFQHISKTGRKDMLMTPLDFYSSITPDCSLAFVTGSGVHVDVTDEEVNTGDFYWGKSAALDSLLNKVGKERNGKLNRDGFVKFHTDLLEEVIQLEFSEYDKASSGRISESDLCHFLLKNSKIPPKKQAAML